MHHVSDTRRQRLGRALAAVVLLGVGVAACSSSDGDDPKNVADVQSSQRAAAGTVLDQRFTKPDLVLTDTRGKSFDLVKETQGQPTLVYFGYTNCPDVCPLTMSNLAYAKKQLPAAEQKKLRVVFITSDPERDTPESLRTWLRAQDPEFIGLTGDFEKIQPAARSLGINLDPAVVEEDGSITSTHGTQVLAFSPKDDQAYVLYNQDVPVETYVRDLPKLIRGENP